MSAAANYAEKGRVMIDLRDTFVMPVTDTVPDPQDGQFIVACKLKGELRAVGVDLNQCPLSRRGKMLEHLGQVIYWTARNAGLA